MIVQHDQLSVREQCALLKVNRSTLYYQPSLCVEDLILANEMSAIWNEVPTYGYRRICAELRRRGYRVNHKRVLRIMRESALQAIYPKKKRQIKNQAHKIFPYLLKGLQIIRPNQVWATDLTYIKVIEGFVYLMAIIDIYSRQIIAWDVSNSMDLMFCLSILEAALAQGIPDIINTDQGSQYTSAGWTDKVMQAGAKVSMDSVGRWADNIHIERFWRTVKWENILLKDLRTVDEVRACMHKFIIFYNEQRLHSSLGYNTPNDVYNGIIISKPVILGLRNSQKDHSSSEILEARFDSGLM